MIKIKGLSEQEIIDIGNKVAFNHSAKKFDYHNEDDIYQQVWIIILQQIDQFQPDRINSNNIKQGLENWLNGVVSKRLKNFYRDNFAIKQQSRKTDKNESETIKRKSLQHPVAICEVGEIIQNLNILDDIEFYDIWDFIVKELTWEEVDVLDAILSGEIVPQYYKTKLSLKLKDLIFEYNYVEER